MLTFADRGQPAPLGGVSRDTVEHRFPQELVSFETGVLQRLPGLEVGLVGARDAERGGPGMWARLERLSWKIDTKITCFYCRYYSHTYEKQPHVILSQAPYLFSLCCLLLLHSTTSSILPVVSPVTSVCIKCTVPRGIIDFYPQSGSNTSLHCGATTLQQ